ncbi:probable 37S ribosomal protein SWS2, mitochondrial [Saccharomycodes ludwigii]|uniref:Small ribosomal subunit protein uS13m n=1 Tax=Saccharomycodes ludwigii TaxID=36035 RepID=A0A376B939_9ASCO|nr:probable 37S ribosomal protein SWS2, mitochondrial [Saccharomycodes ludwigii]
MVVHILGKGFKGKEVVRIGLSSKFYGIGLKTAEAICSRLGFYPWMRMHQLTEPQLMMLTKELSEMTIEGDARAIVKENIALKRKIGSYAGLRHAMNLPVRGQNTRNNANTARRLNKLDRRGYHTVPVNTYNNGYTKSVILSQITNLTNNKF